MSVINLRMRVCFCITPPVLIVMFPFKKTFKVSEGLSKFLVTRSPLMLHRIFLVTAHAESKFFI